jgi:hypothetical protein
MEAEEAVGAWQSDDWKVTPRSQAEKLPAEARQLIDVLMSSELEITKQAYDLADAEAVRAQIEYKSSGRRAIYLYSAAAIFGALVLYASTDASPDSFVALVGTKIRIPLLILQAASLGGAAYYTYLLRENAPFEGWMASRAKAEAERRRLFEQVLAASPTQKQAPEEIDLAPLQLEYFRRYHLETQLNYFLEREAHHGKAARRFVTGGALLALVTTIAVALGGLASDLGEWIAPLALVGVAAPVLAAANNNLKLLSQDRRNAARYHNAADKLREKQKTLAEIRRKVGAGEADALQRFAAEVNDIISLENAEWLKLASKEDQRPQFSPVGAPPAQLTPAPTSKQGL